VGLRAGAGPWEAVRRLLEREDVRTGSGSGKEALRLLLGEERLFEERFELKIGMVKVLYCFC
jgi:hypothetical protein